MKLRKMVIKDFRPFRGIQEISFSCGNKLNVTVVHAENGLGKTALLNALLWGLYGKEGLTEDVEKPDRLVNEITAATGKDNPIEVYTEVEIFFDQDDEEYTLRRRLTLAQQRSDPSKTDVRLEYKQFGQTHKVAGTPTEVQNRISAILPKGISPYLFFNGERMSYLGSSTNSGDIRNAIHQMLGLNLLQQTIEDLESQNVAGRFRRELREDADEAMQKLLDEQEKLEKQRIDAKSTIDKSDIEIQALQKEIRTIDAKLKANAKVQALQKEREDHQDNVRILEVSIQDSEKELRRLISEEACMLFTETFIIESRRVTSELRSEGQIPARVLKDFIQDLLKAEECICKRSLKAGSPEYNAVLEQLESSPDVSFNEAVSSLDNAIGAMDGKSDEVRRRIKDAYRHYEDLREGHRQKVARIKEISETIGEKDDEELRDLERSREEKNLKIRMHESDKGRAQERIESAIKDLNELNRKVEQCRQKVGKADLSRRRLAETECVAELLRKMLEVETQELRVILNEEIRENFSKIIFKDYWAEITPDFDLKIHKRAGGEVIEAAKSTGENQITAFAFIGSLVALAQRRDKVPSILRGVQGGEYPIVMDSPFGSLGEGYRESVACMLPKLAPQVVVFVSPTQWKGEVERNLKQYVDKQYLLQYHGKQAPQNLAENVEIYGMIIPQIVAAEQEMTLIKEVK